MNIFKVLASGKKSFQEETASAIITWFMHPAMEHGLGYTFLSKFIQKLSKISGVPSHFSAISKNLVNRMRSEQASSLKLSIDLEYNVGNALIDILFQIDQWTIAIENKIYVTSTSDGQLLREYEGLKKDSSRKYIGMIYLVPVEENAETLYGKTETEFAKLLVDEGHFKAIVTWQRSNIENTISIAEIINEILQEESQGVIDPISEYTRHTLKALNSFISNNFTGYDYERKTSSQSKNPLTEAFLGVSELSAKEEGFVGVKGGLQGLIKSDVATIQSYSFQYTSKDMQDKQNWLDVCTFNKVSNWLLYDIKSDIAWEGSFSSDVLYRITLSFGETVFIGIKGGAKALEVMNNAIIKDKKWQISTEKSSLQWVSGSIYHDIIKKKGVFN